MKYLTPEKSIVPYLKYYIGCIRVFCERRNTELTLDGDLIDRFNEHHEDIADYKFLFRKLSSMTEEEKLKLFQVCFGEDHNFDMFGFDTIEQIILADKNGRSRVGISLKSMSIEGFHYLISKGFWIFDQSYFDLGIIIEKKMITKDEQIVHDPQ